ncbi:PepSY-associated TM helix domain-containing protein [Paracoccus aminophilus]|uniref:PepSY-associated TM helix domain-containing protein n=1 Tax=Paracoccus aminophilus JCM 7686 TaxID=1367847 RepID=S5XYU8_PARAH|nr:PepSY-associated TM helix domain-containing protein [Paracoccus aminophilus]AGT08610.1 hypothetical protein JCM7686_1509 [Paracoccus aminophilus JCM 7686]
MSQTAPAHPSAAKPAKRKKSGMARLWLLLHGWLALPIWAYVFFICVTGTIATVSHEIQWLLNTEVRASRPSGAEERLGADALAQAVLAQNPGAQLQSITWPVERHFAPTVRIGDPSGEARTLYVNPYDGHVQGEQPTVDFRYFTRALHGWLFAPWTSGYSWGWYAVSILGLPMLGSLITGILVYKKFWRAYFKPRLRFGKGARTFWGDFHRLAGIWSIPFIAIIGITATWFLIEAILSDSGVTLSTAGIPTVLERNLVPDVALRSELPPLSLDATIAAAEAANPGLRVDSIFLPSNAFSPIELFGRGAIPLFYESAAVNPYNIEVVKTRGMADQTAVELITASMYPLHFGDFMGVWLKVLYFLFGLMLSMMVLSGMLIWTKRTVGKTKDIVKERRAPRLDPNATPVMEPGE